MSDDNIKTRPSDSSEIADAETEENEKSSNSDDEYFKDLEELEKARKEREDKRKQELERLRKDRAAKKKNDNEENESSEGKGDSKDGAQKIGGQSVSRAQKEFTTEKKLFRHNKMFGFSGRGTINIERALKKAHIDADKRRGLIDALSAYNPSKSVLKKRDFEMFARKFKSKNFSGTRFQQASKTIDMKGIRKELSKRDLNRFRMAVTGDVDAHKHQTKTVSTKAGKPDRKPGASKH